MSFNNGTKPCFFSVVGVDLFIFLIVRSHSFIRRPATPIDLLSGSEKHNVGRWIDCFIRKYMRPAERSAERSVDWKRDSIVFDEDGCTIAMKNKTKRFSYRTGRKEKRIKKTADNIFITIIDNN